MCGIAGYIDFTNTTQPQTIQKMTATLAHRGPDGDGFFEYAHNNYQLAFGHRRLSIIDLSNHASQPMHYKNFTIVFNGEIYNYQEIKDELISLGHHFETHSDTEVILHSYEQWGKKCLNKFIGMFAFVIHNTENNQIFGARDRAGIKPFHYFWNQQQFIFGSELKALIANPQFEKNINLQSVKAYMQYGYVPTPHSIFQNTFKLKPGYYFEFDLTQKQFITAQYWSVYNAYNKPTLDISFDEALTETERILTKAFQYRMVSDVPVGIFLSGGFDSTAVTALLQKNNTQQLKTFTIGVPDAGLNEAPYAKEIAAYLGTNHTEYYCTAQEALNIVPTLPYFYDEPFADSSAIPTTLVSRVARQQVTVALSADAGDEVFAGYNRYDFIHAYGNKLSKIPSFAKKALAGVMRAVPVTAVPVIKNKYNAESRYEKMKNILRNNSEQNLLASMVKLFNDDDVNLLFKNNVAPLKTAFDEPMFTKTYSNLEYAMAVDYETYLLDDILQKVDRATMSTSLEGREPFLDQHIIEWAAQLPMEYKYHNGQKKYILKQLVYKYVPKQLMDRPKMGFGIPIADWLKNELSPVVEDYLNADLLEKQGIFNVPYITRLKTAFMNGKAEYAEKIWYLLVFQMWYKQWM